MRATIVALGPDFRQDDGSGWGQLALAAATAFCRSSSGSAPDRTRSPTTQLGVPVMPSLAAVSMFLAISASAVLVKLSCVVSTPALLAAAAIEASLTGPPA